VAFWPFLLLTNGSPNIYRKRRGRDRGEDSGGMVKGDERTTDSELLIKGVTIGVLLPNFLSATQTFGEKALKGERKNAQIGGCSIVGQRGGEARKSDQRECSVSKRGTRSCGHHLIKKRGDRRK